MEPDVKIMNEVRVFWLPSFGRTPILKEGRVCFDEENCICQDEHTFGLDLVGVRDGWVGVGWEVVSLWVTMINSLPNPIGNLKPSRGHCIIFAANAKASIRSHKKDEMGCRLNGVKSAWIPELCCQV